MLPVVPVLGRHGNLFQNLVDELRAHLLPLPSFEIEPRPALVVGHRGCLDPGPENTVAACAKAVSAGANAVEIDLCITRDDELVLWHDPNPDDWVALARQSGMEGGSFLPRVPPPASEMRRCVSELTFAEVNKFCGYIAGRAANAGEAFAPIDRLDDLFAWAASEPRLRALMIDVKLAGKELERVHVLGHNLGLALARHPELGKKRIQLLCPRASVFRAVKSALAVRPELHGVLPTADFEGPGVARTARKLGAAHVSIGCTARYSWARVLRDLSRVLRARARGELSSVTLWTINEPERLQLLLDLGVDALITDQPELCANLLSARTRAPDSSALRTGAGGG